MTSMQTAMKRTFLTAIFLVTIFISSVYSADNSFKNNNPDGQKYEFVRSYISALGYFHTINQRWAKNPPKKKFKGDDARIILGTMEALVQDNVDLRVAKNYMIKYLSIPNPFMRKVSDMMIVVCDSEISLNNKSKFLWQDWLNLKSSGIPNQDQEKIFIKSQRDIELKRKEYDKMLIQASIYLTKVVLSQENLNDKGKLLAITEVERDKLLDNLDQYGKGILDWGLKAGQSSLKASVSVIREVLEDPIYTSRK
jgi:hypothetical protein